MPAPRAGRRPARPKSPTTPNFRKVQRSGDARVHRQPGAHQGSDQPRSLASQAPSAGARQLAVADRGIKAGLLMLGKTRAMEVVERIARTSQALLQAGGPRFADAEGNRPARGRDRQPRVLHGDGAGRAQRSVVHARQRRSLPRRRCAMSSSAWTVPPFKEPEAYAATVVLARCRGGATARAHADARGRAAWTSRRCPTLHQSGAAASAPEAEHLDPELLEIIIEEAREEVASIKQAVPGLGAEPDDMDDADRRAPLLPYAQGQRPHGRCRAISANSPGPSRTC